MITLTITTTMRVMKTTTTITNKDENSLLIRVLNSPRLSPPLSPTNHQRQLPPPTTTATTTTTLPSPPPTGPQIIKNSLCFHVHAHQWPPPLSLIVLEPPGQKLISKLFAISMIDNTMMKMMVYHGWQHENPDHHNKIMSYHRAVLRHPRRHLKQSWHLANLVINY